MPSLTMFLKILIKSLTTIGDKPKKGSSTINNFGKPINQGVLQLTQIHGRVDDLIIFQTQSPSFVADINTLMTSFFENDLADVSAGPVLGNDNLFRFEFSQPDNDIWDVYDASDLFILEENYFDMGHKFVMHYLQSNGPIQLSTEQATSHYQCVEDCED